MKTIKYSKLIRDKIPEIIESNGEKYVVEVMTDEEYSEKLCEKLQEEVKEFLCEVENNSSKDAVKELADIVEVVYAFLDMYGVSRESFKTIQESKVLSNGAFKNKLLLKEVIKN